MRAERRPGSLLGVQGRWAGPNQPRDTPYQDWLGPMI